MVTNNVLADKMGGHERYVSELASTLSGRGVEVTIVAKRWRVDAPAREIRSDGVVVERYAVPSKRNPLYALAFPAYVALAVIARTRRLRPRTVIHAHMGLPAIPLAVSGKPYLFTFHAPVWRELLNERQGSYMLPGPVQSTAVSTLRRAEGLVARRAGSTAVLSEFMRTELSLLDRRAAERAALVPGGVDGTRFHPGAEQHASDAHPSPVLFTARRLTPRTGVDELIRAMPLLARSVPDVRLKIAGSGSMEAGLREMARELGVAQSVEFLGRVSDDELVEWYRRATVVVVPTRELEGFGLTTAEALACGAAVVGTPAGATPELLRPIDPGLVTKDTSAESIAAAVLELLAQPARLTKVRKRASERVLPALSWDSVADRYLDLYEHAR
jgi:glycosyltransferase involved in cell wall biosynthesis